MRKPTTTKRQISIGFSRHQQSWLRTEARRTGITIGELMRRLVDAAEAAAKQPKEAA